MQNPDLRPVQPNRCPIIYLKPQATMCRPTADAKASGAPEIEANEVEITPAMLDAGRYAFAQHWSALSADTGWEDPVPELLADVFRAMHRSRGAA